MNITKRDGSVEEFNINKIYNALNNSFKATYDVVDNTQIDNVIKYLKENFNDKLTSVESIQDCVEDSLMKCGFHDVAKNYILYRKKRENIRASKSKMDKVFHEILKSDKSDLLRENANLNSNSPMGLMLLFGSEFEKDYVLRNLISPKYAQMHTDGYIHIHDLNFYACTFNCCHIDLETLFKNGFDTGDGHIRRPNSIQSATSLSAIIIQSNQNDMFGGQGIPMFDYNLAPYVAISFAKRLRECLEILLGVDNLVEIENICKNIYNENGSLLDNLDRVKWFVNYHYDTKEKTSTIVDKALSLTDRDTYQAMEGFIHNMNSLHSRAGAQTPFSSINYGTGTTAECRMIIKDVLKATEAGLGNHETPIFPIQIFKTKEGVNALPGDPNYDLYQYACKVTPKRFYPNYTNIDTPSNIQYYREGKPETEMATMGCRTRVIGQLNTEEGSVKNRGNIAFTTINLPRIALETQNIDEFFRRFDEIIDDCVGELLERVNFISKKKVYNFPFLMGQNLYMGSEKLDWNDDIEPALKNGTLSVGFCGLAECLKCLTGKHHGESDVSYDLGVAIISYLREKTDKATEKYGWYFSTFATPAESTAGKFLKLDRKKFGIVEGVTDRDYYTNSFHIPVYYKITAFEKMKKEGVFHELCNAGAITYIELDGDAVKNSSVVQKLVDYSRKCGISYFSINTIHDVCPVCGYDGIINTNKCPSCGWIEGTEVEYKM